MKLLCDNKATIDIGNNLVQHDRNKHVEINKHFIKESQDNGSICISYKSSNQYIVDILTMGLLRQNFDSCVCKLGISNIYVSQLEGKC